MRVSTQQLFLQNIASISDLNAQTQRAQQQIASGKKQLSAADDPVSAARILQLEGQLSASEQYQRNIELAENRLQLIESSLASAETIIFRVQELMVQANDGALSNSDRQAIALEIDERLSELADLTNTRDRDGDYIFAGFKTEDAPFVKVGGSYQYRGDEGVRLVQTSNSSYTAISESGEALFNNIATGSNLAVASAIDSNSSAVVVTSVEVVDQAQFDAVFGEDYVIEFNPGGNIVPAGPNYSITRRSDGAVIATNQPYDPATGISVNGLQLSLSGTPLPGDQFLVESTRSRDMLSTVQFIADNVAAIDNDADRQAFFQQVDIGLDNILESLSRGRSRIGARLNTLDSTRDTLTASDLNNQEILGEIRDLDYAEAVSNLTFLSFVLEATQQSFVRVSGLSLFNFLR